MPLHGTTHHSLRLVALEKKLPSHFCVRLEGIRVVRKRSVYSLLELQIQTTIVDLFLDIRQIAQTTNTRIVLSRTQHWHVHETAFDHIGRGSSIRTALTSRRLCDTGDVLAATISLRSDQTSIIKWLKLSTTWLSICLSQHVMKMQDTARAVRDQAKVKQPHDICFCRERHIPNEQGREKNLTASCILQQSRAATARRSLYRVMCHDDYA